MMFSQHTHLRSIQAPATSVLAMQCYAALADYSGERAFTSQIIFCDFVGCARIFVYVSNTMKFI